MHFRTILVGVKPASPEAHPLRFAAALATRLRARLTALSVRDATSSGSRTQDPRDHVPVFTVAGVPAIEIARHADSTGADLVVLGRDVPTGGSSRSCGVTAEGVVRRARIPCLLVPSGARAFRRVLIAVDGGPDAPDVIAAARGVAQAYGASVRLARVEEPAAVYAGAPAGREEPTPPSPRGVIVYHGDPVAEILRVARDEAVDLVAFGHHRGGPIAEHATSGVAGRLLQRVPCAVLTVPI